METAEKRRGNKYPSRLAGQPFTFTGPGLRHLHLLILPASPLSRGKWQLSLILAICTGASDGLRGFHLGPHRHIRVTVLHSAANTGHATPMLRYTSIVDCLSAFCVKIAVSRLHENYGPLCCCPGSRPLTAGRLEPLYLWRTMMATIQ